MLKLKPDRRTSAPEDAFIVTPPTAAGLVNCAAAETTVPAC